MLSYTLKRRKHIPGLTAKQQKRGFKFWIWNLLVHLNLHIWMCSYHESPCRCKYIQYCIIQNPLLHHFKARIIINPVNINSQNAFCFYSSKILVQQNCNQKPAMQRNSARQHRAMTHSILYHKNAIKYMWEECIEIENE